MSGEWPVSFQDVLSARERIRPYLAPTPLRRYAPLDSYVGLGIRVLVKHENAQPTNAFKVRNALAVATALGEQERGRGLVAATRGNHGLGLAYAGELLGAPVTICVPLGNNPEKNEAMRGHGAELVEAGRDYDEAVEVAERLARERGMRLVHSTNDRAVLAGAATLTLEILEQADQLDAMVVAVGGGSQAVGALTVARRLKPGLRVYAVQAEARSRRLPPTPSRTASRPARPTSSPCPPWSRAWRASSPRARPSWPRRCARCCGPPTTWPRAREPRAWRACSSCARSCAGRRSRSCSRARTSTRRRCAAS